MIRLEKSSQEIHKLVWSQAFREDVGLIIVRPHFTHSYGPILHLFSGEMVPHIDVFRPIDDPSDLRCCNCGSQVIQDHHWSLDFETQRFQ